MELRGLKLPAALAVSVLVSGCPAGDDGDTGADSTSNITTDASTSGSTSASTSASTSTGTEESSTRGETTIADSSGSEASSSETGEPVDCENVDAKACAMTPTCAIHPEIGICVLDCDLLEDQASCNQGNWCEWTGTECIFSPVD